MSDLEQQLNTFRAKIDEIDEKIVALLNDRAKVVLDIGKAKDASGGSTYVPNRESEVLDRVSKLNPGPLPDQTIRAIYRELMSGSLVLEQPPRIAYLGPPGSFSHMAAKRKFGSTVEYEALRSITAVFDEVERRRADLGLVPIENTTGGGVTDTLDALIDRQVTVCGELNLGVHLHLLGKGTIEQVEKVYSKPEAFAQCRGWLTETGLIDKMQGVSSTSRAAELAADDPTAAGIGSALAGEIYGLNRLADSIEDNPNNVTRFLVIGQTPAKPTGDDKTAIYFHAADRPGALVEVLAMFRQLGINMTFIQSRPARQKGFDYAFFVDVEGHRECGKLPDALEHVTQFCNNLKLLGSFPYAREVL